MALESIGCPHCGVKINIQPTSYGTLRQCKMCGQSFIPEIPPPQPFNLLGCLIALGISASVIACGCCGGFSLISSALVPKPSTATIAKQKVAPLLKKESESKRDKKAIQATQSDPQNIPQSNSETSLPLSEMPGLKETSEENRHVDETKSYDSKEVRTWMDKTKKFSAKAKFGGMIATTVTLHKIDGKTIKIEFEELSEQDQAWIEDRKKYHK